jgi:succinoglycan biosynthesis transport protein ExoP
LEVLKSDAIARDVIKKLKLENDDDFMVKEPPGLLRALGLGSAGPQTEAQKDRHLMDVFDRLRIIRRIGPSFAIEVGFKSHSAARAAQVANAIAEAYVEDLAASRRIAARNAGDWLQERLTELRRQVAESENAVVEFRANNDIIDAGGKKVVTQQIAEISSQITVVRSQLSDASARLDRARTAAREYATSVVKPAMTETLNNPLTNKLLEQYFELSNREAEYADRFGAEHTATLKLRQRIEEVKAGLLNDMQRLSQSFLSEKTVLEKRLQDLEASLKVAVASLRKSEQAEVKLHELERIAQSYRSLYDGLLHRHSEAILQQEQQPITGARIISAASEPLHRNMKKPLLAAAVLAFGGMGLGVALSFLSDLRDRTLRTSSDVERKLRSDFIGMIPTWRPPVSGKALVPAHAQKGKRGYSPYWAFLYSPVSAFAQGIGCVKLAILRQAETKDGRIIGFTSVLPNEGASTVAAAVAHSLSKSGRSVVLVDCDLRHPELTREYAPQAKAGLQDLLFGHVTLDDVIITDWPGSFAFLPGVIGGLMVSPEELLEATELASTLKELRKRYDYVVVDLPPMFPMLDVSMTDHLIESYVVVVEWGASKIDTVAHALTRCPGVRNRMLGFVLNKVDMTRLSLYDGCAADYYDTKRYSNYLIEGPTSDPAKKRTIIQAELEARAR